MFFYYFNVMISKIYFKKILSQSQILSKCVFGVVVHVF